MSKHKNGHSDSHYYRSLKQRLILTIILVSFTPLILVSAIILDQFGDSYTQKMREHLIELIEKHKQNIDNFLKEKMGDIRFLAASCSYQQLSDEDFIQNRLDLLQSEYGPVFQDLGVISHTGRQISYAGPFKSRLKAASHADALWFQKAMQQEYFISDVFLGFRKLPHFIISVQKRTPAGQKWLMRATIDFFAFNSLVEKLRIGKTGFAFILNQDGEFQTQPMSKQADEKCCLEHFLNEGNEAEVQFIRRVNEAGDEVIYVGSFLKDGDWLLVFQQEADDAYADLNRAQHTALLILFVGGLCIVAVSLILSHQMVDRIVLADQEKALMNQQVIETGKLASIGELAAGIAHEINNPVAIMVEEAGWISDLLEDEEFKDGKNLREFHRSLNQINAQGKRCKEITHKLLSFARKTDFRIHDVQPNQLITEVLELSGQRAKYSNVQVETDLDPRLPSVHISLTEFQQLLLNLINNALYAMEKAGGKLSIRTRHQKETLVVEVADTGPGIPPANLNRIFDPFYTTKPVGKGTGLGLSICYGIVKKMGGEIDVDSVVDQGTTFRIQIPLKQPLGEPETRVRASDNPGKHELLS